MADPFDETLKPPTDEALSPERRAQILEGAASIFIRDGYEGASMSQIAAAAAVSKGTLYNYYPGKKALFTAFVSARCAQLVRDVFSEQPAGITLEQGLARIGKTMLRVMVSPRGLAIFRLVIMEASKFPDLAETFMNAGPRTMVARLADWLGEEMAASRLDIAEPVFAAEQFFSLTQARLVLQARADPGYVPSETEIAMVVSGAVRVFMAAYGKP